MRKNVERDKPGLAEIFAPRSIAIVGVSGTNQNSVANEAMIALKKAGFPTIYPVNPKYPEIMGLPCYPTLRQIPGTVDHVFMHVPAEASLAVLDECVAKNVKSVHFFTAGFSEAGRTERAIELEKAILKKAREGGFRVIGPNCTGPLIPKSRLITRRVMTLEPGPIAFLTQSGGYADDVPFLGNQRGLRFSNIVSFGNALDVNESELLEYFSHDPDTEIIAAYIEGIKEGRRFFDVIKETTARKPIVIQKGGVTEAGKRAAYGHTASMINSAAILDALCRQLNVIQVDNLEELIDMLVVLRFTRPFPLDSGVAVLGTGGGPTVLISDEMEKAGLHLPPISIEMQAELTQFLPREGSILANPVDALTLTSPEAIYSTLRVIGKMADINMFVYHMGFHPISQWGDGRLSSASYLKAVVNAFKQIKEETGKPIILALRPALDLDGMKDFLTAQAAFVDAQFPVLHTFHGMARAVARLVHWHKVFNMNRNT